MAATADPLDPRVSSPLTTPAPTMTTYLPNSSAQPPMPMTPPAEDADEEPATEPCRPSSPPRGRAQTSPQTPSTSDGEQAANKARSPSRTLPKTPSTDHFHKLSASEMKDLAASPESLPVGPAPPRLESAAPFKNADEREAIRQALLARPEIRAFDGSMANGQAQSAYVSRSRGLNDRTSSSRTLSTPPSTRSKRYDNHDDSSPPRRFSLHPASRPMPLNLDQMRSEPRLKASIISPAPKTGPPALSSSGQDGGIRPPSPMPTIIPLPPMSIPTHLQLELAAQRPSPLYIHHSNATDIPYESSAVKFERLKNVLLIPPYLERTLYFGALACLDAWLYTFTILPIRFFIALGLLFRWWAYVIRKEVQWVLGYVWSGIGRLWERERTGRAPQQGDSAYSDRSRSQSRVSESSRNPEIEITKRRSRPGGPETLRTPTTLRDPGPKSGSFKHRRTKSIPSLLSQYHKADLLQGAVIICSSMALMTLDASRMYHFIRAQSAIKLYVIYNILEVSDRLLSAFGQDIFECLFSAETLSRNASGRSKILLPLGMFIMALVYNCLHSIALYYQVITLNVAVNSYSNALLTLLLSNQFVEIKSTVFKRFEKDNLFQLTCADIVERFHLWIMLLIIGMRNIVEVGGLSVPGAMNGDNDDISSGPRHHPSILPHSFTVLPSWLISGEVISPFLIVLGSEMLVDTIKHAYVTKFNNIKPKFYGRILDVLCKDYYTNAFTTPSLTRRLGLAVIPLSCLFIRASVQAYHMFLSTYIPMPLPQSTQTSLSQESATPSSPAVIAALNRFDSLIRDSLGRATYGYPYGGPRPWYAWTTDDFIAALTMVIVFFIVFLVFLILKLTLGMLLLKYSRNRYAQMKQKEQLVALGKLERESFDAKGRRVGGRGEIEVTDDKQRWIHADPNEGLRGSRGPGGKRQGDDGKKKVHDGDFQGVFRYEMVNKRIW